MIDLGIDKASVEQFKGSVRALDKDVQRSTVKGIKDSMKPLTNSMKSDIRSRIQEPPMSGMGKGNKKANRYRNPNITTSLTLLAGRGNRVAQIVGRGAAGHSRMFNIVERAGSRSSGFTPEGQRMIRVLESRYPLVKGKGGRVLFFSFLKFRPQIHDHVMKELNTLAGQLNTELRRG